MNTVLVASRHVRVAASMVYGAVEMVTRTWCSQGQDRWSTDKGIASFIYLKEIKDE